MLSVPLEVILNRKGAETASLCAAAFFLADKLALSRRTLERRFKKATSNTVTEYVQRVKIEPAKKDL